MWTVYVLKSEKDHRRYIGVTQSLFRRIKEHERGGVSSTKHRRPLHLLYIEVFAEKTAAFHREHFFKTGRGRAVLNQLLKQAVHV